MTRRALVVCVVGLVLVASASSQEIQSRHVYSVTTVDAGFTLEVGGASYGPYTAMGGTPWFSQDAAAWAMVLRKPDATTAILVNGAEKAVFKDKDYTSIMEVSLSPDGAHWSARASLPTDARTRNVVLVDGKAYGPFDQVDEVVWAPSGAGWYVTARTGSSLTVAREGKQYGPMQDARDFAWDPTGRRLAFTEFKAGGSYLRIDDKEYGPYAEAAVLKAGNGTFLGWYDKQANGSGELTIADKKYGPYTYMDWGREYISQDGKDWLVMVFRGAKRILLQNGKETELGRLSVARLSRGWMYTYETNTGEYVVFNGTQSGPFDTGRNLTVMRDGTAWAISHLKSATGGDRPFVTVNGIEYPGTAFADVAGSSGEYFSWISGGVDGDGVYQRFAGTLTSTTLYSVSRDPAGVTVSSGGSSWGPYREISGSPWVSPDGAHWGLVARTDDTHFVTLVDGRESAALGPYARAYDFSINDTGTGWSFTAMPSASAPDTLLKVVNGKEYGPVGWADKTVFSRDGKAFWFWATTAGKSPSGFLVFNGKTVGPFKSDFERRFLDVEAGVFALVSRGSGGTSIRVNDDTFGPYQDVTILKVGTTDPDSQAGRYFGFVDTLKDNSRELHVQGGSTFGPYRTLDFQHMWISPDGRSWMAAGRRAGADSDVLIVNGEEKPTMGVDVRPWAGGYFVFARQRAGDTFSWAGGSAGPYTGTLQVVFSQDGAAWAAEEWRGDGPSSRNLVVVNGREYEGQRLRHVNTAAGEYFTWFAFDDDRSGILTTVKLR